MHISCAFHEFIVSLAIALQLANWSSQKRREKQKKRNRRCRFTLDKTIYGDTTSILFEYTIYLQSNVGTENISS